MIVCVELIDSEFTCPRPIMGALEWKSVVLFGAVSSEGGQGSAVRLCSRNLIQPREYTRQACLLQTVQSALAYRERTLTVGGPICYQSDVYKLWVKKGMRLRID